MYGAEPQAAWPDILPPLQLEVWRGWKSQNTRPDYFGTSVSTLNSVFSPLAWQPSKPQMLHAYCINCVCVEKKEMWKKIRPQQFWGRKHSDFDFKAMHCVVRNHIMTTFLPVIVLLLSSHIYFHRAQSHHRWTWQCGENHYPLPVVSTVNFHMNSFECGHLWTNFTIVFFLPQAWWRRWSTRRPPSAATWKK